MERVLKSENLQVAVLVPGKKKPRIIVHDVPNVMSEKELLASLPQRNLNSSENERPHDEVRISPGSGNAESINIMLEVSHKTKAIFLKQDRVYIG